MTHRFIGLLKTRDHANSSETIGELIDRLGETSFGWCLLIFSLLNLLPLPLGANMITSVPLILVALQMTAGMPGVRLPARVAAKPLPRVGLRRGVARLRPMFRILERMARPRFGFILDPRYRRLIGLAILALTFALFLPIPLSGWGPALSILVISFGLVERDGGIVLGGLALGVVSILIVVAVVFAIAFGVNYIPRIT
jgi:hypothetical protein